MNRRQLKIIKILLNHDSSITSEYLSSIIQVSSKTIRNDIRKMNREYDNIGLSVKSQVGKGYYIEVSNEDTLADVQQLMDCNSEYSAGEMESRVEYLLYQFFFQKKYIKSQDLMNDLFISRSTLQKHMNQVRNILSKYQLSLKTVPNYGLTLNGEESNIRSAMASEMIQTGDNAIAVMNSSIIGDTQVQQLKSLILDVLKEFQLTLSDIALNNITIQIIIVYKRVSNGHWINRSIMDYAIEPSQEFQIANNVLKKVEECSDISFPHQEAYYIAMQLRGTRLSINEETIETSLKEKDVFHITKDILEAVEKRMGYEFIHDEELFHGLMQHLNPVMYRYFNNIEFKNPVLPSIKNQYPVAFEAGIVAKEILADSFNIYLGENETGYLALHFGAALERKKSIVHPKRCLLVCTSGIGSSKLLYYKLKANFGNQLFIEGTTELFNLSQYNTREIDLVISTVPLPEDISIPHIVVNTILGNKDLSLVRSEIENTRNHIVKDYLEEEAIYINMDFQTPEETIRFLGGKLSAMGLVEPDFTNSVLEREAAASTSYGNLVAIPHPYGSRSKETFWSVCTLKRPITWGGNIVQVVFLLHVADNNAKSLEPMYQYLIQFIDNEQKVHQLINSESKSQVIRLLNNS
ncbi:BglG family transcription antiterminator [Salibacterium lacus]|uniref:BglG family transcription antiterminator n=1 Tax=Salibacterium lacus TaxID=1898109 RepID=A0ABW5T610_9BACI